MSDANHLHGLLVHPLGSKRDHPSLIPGSSGARKRGTTTAPSQYLQDPGFELGHPNAHWVESAGSPPLIDNHHPRSGIFSADLCGANNCTEEISQSVTIPTSLQSATLSYWFYFVTSESPVGNCFDFLGVGEQDANLNYGPAKTYCENWADGSWHQDSIDITAFLQGLPGQTVRFFFLGSTDFSNPSQMFVDDTSLSIIPNAPGAPGPPLNPSATAGPHSAQVNWNPPTSDGGSALTSYTVNAYVGSTLQGSQTVSGSPPPTRATFASLTDGVTYTFEIAATNTVATGALSVASNAVTPSTPPSRLTAVSTAQYTLAGSDGTTWRDVDLTSLSVGVTPAVDSMVVLSANVDLWTETAGYNQDIGISVRGGSYPTHANQPEAWKESGGFAGTYSPNAALVQAVVTMTHGVTYSVVLQWKTNKNAPGGTIAAGAGPIGSSFSPTRLTAQLVPVSTNTVASKVSTQQYQLASSGGSTWQDVDLAKLGTTVTPSVDSLAVVSGNADLWTATAGYNQDLGVKVSGSGGGGPAYPTVAGQPQAWKESGGFAGTYSPNAAFVQAVVPMTHGVAYTVNLQWKANRPAPGSFLQAGAGPINGNFSPTSLTVQLVPVSPSTVTSTSSVLQYPQANSDGATWREMDATKLSLSFTPPSTCTAVITANADLWTASAGYNQDIGIALSGGSYPSVAGQPEAWKESGGFAGTYSPNAAAVQSVLPVTAGTAYTVKLQWKTNRPAPGATIYAGAGPIAANYSPSSLVVVLVGC